MKKRFIVLSSLITILLASFPMVVFADEVAQDSSNLHTLSDGVLLDQYFYDNYDLLPYVESDGTQYIDLGVKPSSNIGYDLKFSNFEFTGSGEFKYLFGCYDNSNIYGSLIRREDERLYIYIGNTFQSTRYLLDPYIIHSVSIMGNNGYYDNQLIVSRDTDYSLSINCYLFCRNLNGNSNSTSKFRLYSFKIIDLSANDGEGEYLRYYYPAKAKASNTIGLYDAVNKTFVTTGSSTPFVNPTNDKVLNFQISDFITSGLSWIDDIFDFVIATPIILFFFAVALAGSVYRWARRVVHF